ncbi:MAG: contractile injection system protein, VgrG/Pvc8 family, partial [Acetobacteraceae bacterium]
MTSPLGDDQLIPISLSAQESISEPFYFDVTAVCQSGLIDPNQLLDNAACITLRNAGGDIRYFHGIVQHVRAMNDLRGPAGITYRAYQIIMVPRLWFLGQTVDCR